MSGYREHMRTGFWFLVILTVGLALLYAFANIQFLNADFLGTFDIFGLGVPIVVIGFLLGLYASLLPDIDIGTSKVYQYTVAFLLLVAIIFIYMGTHKWETIAILVFLFIILFMNHRGILHSWWMGFIFAFFFALMFGGSAIVGIYVLVGYYAHKWEDR